MMEQMLEKLKLKIDEARAKLNENAKERANEQFKADIEAQIASLESLMAEIKGKGESAVDTFLARTNAAIEKLEESLKK